MTTKKSPFQGTEKNSTFIVRQEKKFVKPNFNRRYQLPQLKAKMVEIEDNIKLLTKQLINNSSEVEANIILAKLFKARSQALITEKLIKLK